MSYYRGCKDFKTTEEKILNEFYKGIRLKWNPNNNTYLKEPLEKGKITKYNKEIINRFEELYDDFNDMIAVQMLVLSIYNELNIYDSYIGNVRNMLRAQKETLSVFRLRIKSLKTYPVFHKNIYDSFITELSKDEDRGKRNKNFVNDTLEHFGFNHFISVLFDKNNTSIYNFINNFRRNFKSSYGSVYNDDVYEDYINELHKAFSEYIFKFAKENNVDLLGDIAKAHEEALVQSNIVKQQIKERKAEKQLEKLKASAYNVNSALVEKIMEIVRSGNAKEYISKRSYMNLINALNNMNGECFFVTATKGKCLKIYTYEGKMASTIEKAAYFSSPDCQEIKNVIESLKKEYKEEGISVESINFRGIKDIEDNIKSVANIESRKNLSILTLKNSIQKVINSDSYDNFSTVARQRASCLCYEHDTNRIYYIIAISKSNNAFFVTKMKGMTDICETMFMATSENEVINFLDTVKNLPKFLDFEFEIHSFLLENDKNLKCLKNNDEKTMSCIKNSLKNPEVLVNDIALPTKIHFLNTFDSFIKTSEKYEHLYTIAKISSKNECSFTLLTLALKTDYKRFLFQVSNIPESQFIIFDHVLENIEEYIQKLRETKSVTVYRKKEIEKKLDLNRVFKEDFKRCFAWSEAATGIIYSKKNVIYGVGEKGRTEMMDFVNFLNGTSSGYYYKLVDLKEFI